MSQETFERLSFLSQAAEYLSVYGAKDESRVGSYYQHTGRQIRLKNQVSCFGWDSQKRSCCHTCFTSLTHPQTASLKTRKGFSVLKCLNCGSSRKRFPVQPECKTVHEKQLLWDQRQKAGKCGNGSSSGVKETDLVPRIRVWKKE